MGLADRILEYLRSHPRSRAREIADALGVERQDVNSCLYGALASVVAHDEEYRWRIVDGVTAGSTTYDGEGSEEAPREPREPIEDHAPAATGAFVDRHRTEAYPVGSRLWLVQRAVDAWKRQLIDLGGRNQLLYYRTLKVGTLELTDADPVALDTLLIGRTVRLSNLLPTSAEEPERLDDGLKRAKAVHRKALAWFEERGIQTLYLAWGMATWTTASSSATPTYR